MKNTVNEELHKFHIPVMGTGFTIDTPLKIAKYGISSAVALLDDVLIEQMRKFHSEKESIPYTEIKKTDRDFRARRITSYLNLLDRIVKRQIAALKKTAFTVGSEITRYFELLPDNGLRRMYEKMLREENQTLKKEMQRSLRDEVTPGSIDVNIMTKCDGDIYKNGKKLPAIYSDAMSALRGFAKSKLSSSVEFSAGLNQRLFSYAAEFKDFLPDCEGKLKKKIILKVSDYRSAEVQGKMLAKRGLWVSDFRIESGLNCGGHTFAGKGHLLGTTLEEFRTKRAELNDMLFKIYSEALISRGLNKPEKPPVLKISAQGGIGTNEENDFLINYYNLNDTGWGTPFLLIPEVTNVDEYLLKKLIKAKKRDVYLSNSSPLNVPFWNLRNSASERARKLRIRKGNPGSSCPKRYACFNTEFTDVPICTASRKYQMLKLEDLKNKALLKKHQMKARLREMFQKSCLCHDLAGAATIKNKIDSKVTPAITTGPNILNFSRIMSLEEIVNHIYGRRRLRLKRKRKHMFITELALNIEKMKKDIRDFKKGLLPDAQKQIREYKENLAAGIEYYRNIADQFAGRHKKRFLADLQKMADTLEMLTNKVPV
jgi:hypothetical protein